MRDIDFRQDVLTSGTRVFGLLRLTGCYGKLSHVYHVSSQCCMYYCHYQNVVYLSGLMDFANI